MAEEVPFISMKITLSEEAIKRLAELRQRGSFRSDSATIEECIRAVFDVAMDICLELDRALATNQFPMPLGLQAEAFRRTVLKIGRFGFKTPRIQQLEQMEQTPKK